MRGSSMQLKEPSVAFRELGVEEYELRFTCNIPIEEEGSLTGTSEMIYRKLQREFVTCQVTYQSENAITVGESVLVKIDEDNKNVLVSWSHKDEDIGSHIQKVLRP